MDLKGVDGDSDEDGSDEDGHSSEDDDDSDASDLPEVRFAAHAAAGNGDDGVAVAVARVGDAAVVADVAAAAFRDEVHSTDLARLPVVQTGREGGRYICIMLRVSFVTSHHHIQD